MLKLIADLSTYYSHLKFTWIFVHVGFVIYIQNLPWFLHLAKFWDGTRSGTRWYGCCSYKNVTWLIVLAVICVGGKFAGSQIALAKLSAHGPAQCASRTLRGPQNARQCAERHVRGTRAECVGRGSIARAELSARAVIARSGEWAALSTHFPRTCHAMPTQCNRGSTRVGRTEPQSPGTLRVKDVCVMDEWWIFYIYCISCIVKGIVIVIF